MFVYIGGGGSQVGGAFSGLPGLRNLVYSGGYWGPPISGNYMYVKCNMYIYKKKALLIFQPIPPSHVQGSRSGAERHPCRPGYVILGSPRGHPGDYIGDFCRGY